MTTATVLQLVASVLLVLVAGLLAMVEAAVSRVSRPTVEALVREGRSGADALQRVMADPARFLNVLLLLRLAAELLATVLVTLVCLDLLPGRVEAVAVAALAMVVTSYVFVGVGPRTLGRQKSAAVALRAAGTTLVLTRLLGPLPRLLILVGNALTPGRGFRDGPFASEAELRDLVDLAEERGVVQHGARDMIHSVFELGETLVREVMVPRTEIVFIESGKTVRQAVNLCLRSGFSRLPVVGENEDDVRGVVYLKDLVRRGMHEDDAGATRVEEVMRDAAFVPDSKRVDELLREMQSGQIHIAVVIDEYGGTAGVVTIEDILEEIVGEITDEYDRELPPVETVEGETRRVVARLPVDDLAELYGVELPEDDVDTVAGLMAMALGRVPIPGAEVSISGLHLVAESAKGRRNRIGTVLVRRETVDEEQADGDDARTEADGAAAADASNGGVTTRSPDAVQEDVRAG